LFAKGNLFDISCLDKSKNDYLCSYINIIYATTETINQKTNEL
jgi:hypothetical protein